MKKITFLIFIFLSSYSFAQDSCANGVVLTPGVQQCGNTSEGADVYDNNSCLGSYDGGDDYIFTYTANEDNETLTLTLSGVAGWTGFAMSDFCPDTTGNCLGSETTTSSGTIEFTSDPLSAGVEYYIHISTYPSPQSTDFCLDSVIISPPSCPSPTNLLVNEVSYTTASLSWTAGASEGLWNLEIVDVTAGGSVTGTATETGISNPSTSVSGLSANNDYEFYVQADCGDGTSEWVGPVSFYTGYCQSEPSSNDGSGISNVQLVSTDFTGTDVTYLDFTGTPVDIQQAVTENLQITFVTGYTYDTNVWIDFNDDLVFEASEQVFDGVSTSSNPTTLDASFLVPVNAPLGNHRMRIGTADSGQATPDPCYDGTYGVTVDLDINVIAAPSCLEPSALTSTNISSATANLGWTENGTASVWNVEIVDVTAGGTATGTATDTGVSNPFSVSGLTPNNDYEFYVQADCGGGDTSAWVGPFTFTTACEAFAIPFTETFDSDSVSENCWTVLNENGDTDAWDTNYTSDVITGDENAALNTDYNSGDNDDWLISPTITLTGNERLKFNYSLQSTGEPNDFEVLLSTSGTDIASFTNTILPLASYNDVDIDNGESTELTVDLSSYTGDVNVAWRVPPGGLDGWRLYIDDVVFETLPSCVEPNSLIASATSATDATVTWTAGGAETEWTYEYGLTGFTQGSGTSGTVSTSPSLDLTNLTPGETYDIYIQTNCSGSDSIFITTTWYQPNEGETCDAPIVITTLPYNTSDDTANYGDDYSGYAGVTGCGTTSYYLNGDDVVYAYTATSDTSINVALSSIGSSYSGVFVYTDCADIGTACVAGFGNGSSTADYDFDVVVSNGTTYYIVISTWATPQSTTYTLDITENTCTNPTVNFTVVSDCDNSGGFMIEADVTDLGSATSLTVSDDQGSTNQSASATGVVSFGPYANGTDVTLTITNDQDGTCFVSSDTLTQAVCPPSNDNCAGATMLTQETEIADAASATPNPGTLEAATDSGLPAETCNGWAGTANDDVWYSFEALTTDVTITIDNTTVDIVIQAYSGACGAFTNIGCADSGNPEEIALTGLNVGETYYFRVYQYGTGSTLGDNFDAKVWSTQALSTEDFDKEAAFTYYPNPVNNNLNLSSQKEINNVSVYNMVGQEVYSSTPNTMTDVVDMSGLQAGAYFVKVTVGNATKTVKVIKK